MYLRLLKLPIYMYLLLATLLPATVWEECIKIPQLVDHYFVHERQKPEQSFLAFLVEHYTNDVVHDHQTETIDHDDIPFSDTDSSAFEGNTDWLLDLTSWLVSPSYFFVTAPHVRFCYSLILFREPLLSFWQPPKL